jgi:hypothetical protein
MRSTDFQRASVQRQVLPRRTFLRGVVSGGIAVSIGLPLLDMMLDQNGVALAQGQPIPRRFGVFFWGGGVNHDTWVPAAAGSGWTLPESLTPFSALKDQVTLVTGYNHANSSPGHIPARGIALSSSHDLAVCQGDCVGTYRGQNMPEPSIDVIVSDAYKGMTPFDWLGVGICRKGPYRSNSSWRRGGTAYNRHEPSPQLFWDRLFADAQPSSDDAELIAATSALKISALDAVLEDTNALKRLRLGRADQQRLDQHLEGLRSIELRLQARGSPVPGSCVIPTRPERADFGDGSTHEEKEAKAQLMSEMIAIALACDLSRVFSYEFSATQSGAVYWEVGSQGEHHDDVTHGKARTPEHTRIIQFIMKNFAYLGEQLRQFPEGDGNLLDHTLIVGTSEHADGGSHNYRDHPLLFLGRAGGTLRSGLHHRHPNPANNADAPQLLLTAVRAVGVELAQLGQEGGSGPRVARDSVTAIET